MSITREGLIKRATELKAECANIESVIHYSNLSKKMCSLEDAHFDLYRKKPELENDPEYLSIHNQIQCLLTNFQNKHGRSHDELMKQAFLNELNFIKAFAEDCSTEDELKTADSKLDALDDKYDLAYWSGRGGFGDDEDIFPLWDEVVFAILDRAEEKGFSVKVSGCTNRSEYQDILDGKDPYSLAMEERRAKEEDRRNMIKSKIEINPVYAGHLDYVLSRFLFKYEDIDVESLSKEEIRQETMKIALLVLREYVTVLPEKLFDMNKYDYVTECVNHINHWRAVYRTLNAGH